MIAVSFEGLDLLHNHFFEEFSLERKALFGGPSFPIWPVLSLLIAFALCGPSSRCWDRRRAKPSGPR